MTQFPAFIFSSSNNLCCLSAYFTPMSTPVWQPLVLAWPKDKECFNRWMHYITTPGWISNKTHHASKREERRLDLSHVAVLKQVVGLKDVVRLETIDRDGFDEVRQVLQLHTHTKRHTSTQRHSDTILVWWASSFCWARPVSTTSATAVSVCAPWQRVSEPTSYWLTGSRWQQQRDKSNCTRKVIWIVVPCRTSRCKYNRLLNSFNKNIISKRIHSFFLHIQTPPKKFQNAQSPEIMFKRKTKKGFGSHCPNTTTQPFPWNLPDASWEKTCWSFWQSLGRAG